MFAVRDEVHDVHAVRVQRPFALRERVAAQLRHVDRAALRRDLALPFGRIIIETD